MGKDHFQMAFVSVIAYSPGRKKNPSWPGQEAVEMVRDSTRDMKASVSVNRGKSINPGSGEGPRQTLEEGPVSEGMESWSGSKQGRTEEEKHGFSPPSFQSLAASSHCSNQKSLCQTPRAQSQSWNRGDGEREMANGI